MSSSNNVSGKHVENPDLEELKRLHEACNWKIESHRNLFLEAFGRLTDDWIGEPPNLLEIFAKEEIDWILVACVNSICLYRHVVEFVALCGYKDQPVLDEAGKPVLRCATAIHEIAKNQANGLDVEVLRYLFDIYDKFHVNYIDEVTGYTHLYVACTYGLYDVAEKFLELGADHDYLVPGTDGESLIHFVVVTNQEESLVRTQQVQNDADPNLTNKDGSTCRKLALDNSTMQPDKRIVEELLRRGTDPNVANAKGQTALHLICQRYENEGLLQLLLEVCNEKEKTLRIDARDNEGNTPLHLATLCKSHHMVDSLLRRGADPNVANAKGQTALHLICQRYENKGLLKLLLEVCDEKEKTLRIDARDNEGNTPLHLATLCESYYMIESLLERRADPSLANEEGKTPLHLVARYEWDHCNVTMKLFFRYTDNEWLPKMEIDARDNSGRTALEWAVASGCSFNVETLLLEEEADVSGFVFPTPRDSDRYGIDYNHANESDSARNKLATAIQLLVSVELLQTRDYKLDRDAALKLMGFFDKYGLYDDMDYSTSKDVDDLVDKLFEEMGDMYLDFSADFEDLEYDIPPQFMKDCCLRMCEIAMTKFLRDWVLDPFMELIHYRLPIECCEMIISNLKNKDLFNICLAAAGRSS
ncbi:hypothetical protein TKK_0004543 [Trichogramma kaykai]